MLPASGSCPDRLPITEARLERGRKVAAQPQTVTADVARDTGALLVRASEVTAGHDICTADPWVMGFAFPTTPFGFGPLAYHPTADAMADFAAAVAVKVWGRAALVEIRV